LGKNKLLVVLASAALLVSATAGTVSASLTDVAVSDQTYVRADGGTDDVIDNCNNEGSGTSFGGNRQQNEPSVAINPSEPAFIVAGANDYCTIPSFADAWEGIYVSENGGQSWTDSLIPGYPGDTSGDGQDSPLYGVDTAAGDPILGWDNDSNLFAGGIAFNRTVTTGGTFLTNANVFVSTYSRNTDSPLGIDYERTVIVGKGTPSAFFFGRFNDKPALKVDDWSASTYEGNVYVSWTLFAGAGLDQVLFSRSTDGGLTFSKPIKISKSVPNAQGSDIAVAPDGTVYVVWRQFAFPASGVNDAIVYVKSTNGGASFSTPRTIDPLVGYDRSDTYATGGSARDCGDGTSLCVSNFVFHREDSLPQATVDGDGNVYVTWEQVSPAADNGDTYHPDGQSSVVVTKSDDGGGSWTDPVAADSQSTGHQWWPNLSYDKSTGDLTLIYYDSREDSSYSVNRPPGNAADGTSICQVAADDIGTALCDVLNTFIATSTDGISWDSTKVSSVGHQPEYEMFGNRQVPFHGDYLWVDSAGGTTYGVWTDNRDVVPGSDPRETTQDGFDVIQCRATATDPDTCANAGGLNQNIYGAAISTEP
jgi:hypothetical protein